MAEIIEVSVLNISRNSCHYLEGYSSRISIGNFAGTLSDSCEFFIIQRKSPSSPFTFNVTIDRTLYSTSLDSSEFLDFNTHSEIHSFELTSPAKETLSVTLHFALLQAHSPVKCNQCNKIQCLIGLLKPNTVSQSPLSRDILILSVQENLGKQQTTLHENNYLWQMVNKSTERRKDLHRALEQTPQECPRQSTETQKKLKQLRQRLANSQNQLAESEQHRLALAADCDQLTKKLTETKNTISGLKARLGKAVTNEKKAWGNTSATPAKSSEPKNLKNEYQQKMAQSAQTALSLKTENSQLTEEIAQLESQQSQLEAVNENLISEVAKKGSACSKVASDHGALEFRFKHQMRELESDLEFVTFERDKAKSEKEQLHSGLDSASALEDALKNKINAKLTQTENEIAREKAKGEELQK